MSMMARRVGSATARKGSSDADGLGMVAMIGFRRNPIKEMLMQRVTVVSVPVTDQQTARSFYIDRLGFELLTEATFGDDLHWIQVGPEGSQASLTLVTWFDQMPAGSLRGLVIETDDLAHDYARLTATGVPFLGPPSPQPGGTFATLIDPDGNQISLRQADSPINL
jgi:catechol 2,3-dioxygenase-like lactoylglutathione lyase family enzyme